MAGQTPAPRLWLGTGSATETAEGDQFFRSPLDVSVACD